MFEKMFCRLLNKDTACEVAKIIKKVYPQGHKKLDLPDAEATWQAHQRRDNLVALCFSADKAVGMISLKRSALNDRLYELGMLSVVEEYRRSTAANQLVDFASKALLPLIEYNAVFMENVTGHYYSQRKALQNGAVDCAIALSTTPELAGGERRQNFVVAFLENPQVSPQPIYVPQRYADSLLFFYQGLKTRQMMPFRVDIPVNIATKAEVQEWRTLGLLRQNYFSLGEDLQEYADTIVAYAQKNKTSTVQVLLPLTSPYIDFATEYFVRKGFFVAGVLPYWFDGDVLLLQRCFFGGWEQPKLYSKKARQIWEIIQKDRQV